MHSGMSLPSDPSSKIPPLGWMQTLAIFGAGGLLLFVGTHVLIPLLNDTTGIEPVLSWFIVGGIGVFAPLLMVARQLLRRETKSTAWTVRLRFRRMNRADYGWAIGALAIIGVLSTAIQAAANAVFGGVRLQPSFMAFDQLSPERYWILAVWLPFWILNILGEEILWRGVLLPRQEVALGNRAWLANALGWGVFHFAFGWQLVLILLPILVILPYVVQRRQNTWVAVIIHAGLNGPGFLAVACGFV
jgi:membrane protease YdiL (CAAX protease family)